MAEVFVNDFQTTLSSGINDSTTTIPVAAGTSEASQFRAKIDDEIIIVTAGGTGTSWTATRGAEGTSAASHSMGATVTVVLTDGALDTWMSEQLTTNVTNTYSGTLNAVMDWYAANNADDMDHKITNGDFIALIHHDLDANTGTGGYVSPSTAIHTVTTGKKAVVVRVAPSQGTKSDTGFRGMRLQNTTDTVEVVSQAAFSNVATDVPDGNADSAGGGKLPEVAAGKVIELQTYNQTAATRRRGGFVILKEVDA